MQVYQITHHKKWEARVAAGVCLRHLAEHMQHFTPKDLEAKAGLGPSKLPDQTRDGSQQAVGTVLENFCLEQVLQNGKVLLQSGGEVPSRLQR